MKRIFAMTLMLVLAFCLFAGCGAKKDADTSEAVTGGWSASAPAAAALDADAQAAFDAAADGYTPAALLATQVVSGTNYCFLAWSDADGYVLMKVYADLEGNYELLDTAAIDITADSFGSGTETGLAGGWTVAAAPENALNEEESAVLAAADASAQPYACLGTQIVSGTNYCFLCGSADGLELVYVYNNLNGNSSVSDTLAFDPAGMLE